MGNVLCQTNKHQKELDLEELKNRQADNFKELSGLVKTGSQLSNLKGRGSVSSCDSKLIYTRSGRKTPPQPMGDYARELGITTPIS